MALLARLYYNAVFGAIGGLLGWMLFGVLGDKQAPEELQPFQQLLGGSLIGGAIGYFVVSVEAIRDRSLVRFCRLASYGVVLGAAGGALGTWAGDQVNFLLVGQLGASPQATAGHRLGTGFARGLGWMFLGLAVGVGDGLAARSLGKLSYGILGGTLGGFTGGTVFGLLLEALDKKAVTYVWGQAIGLMILGGCIGALTALVQGVFQTASVKVLRGWQEGREYPILKKDNLLGRDEHADIALFRDMRVEKHHAVIQRREDRFLLVNQQAPSDQTRVNGTPVSGSRNLEDGDRIQLGNVVLRFQLRAASTSR